MRGEQAIFNLEIKKKSGLSINPDIHHSKVFSSELKTLECRRNLYRLKAGGFSLWSLGREDFLGDY